MMHPFLILAQSWMPALDGVGTLLLRVLGVMVLATVVLIFLREANALFGRKPSIDDDVRKLGEAMRGLAPQEKLDVLILKLADSASKADLEALRMIIPTLVTKTELSDRINAIDLHIRGMRHDLIGDLQVLKLDGENRGSELHEDIARNDTKAEDRAVKLHERMSAAEKTMSAIDERTKTTNHTMDSMTSKIDTLLLRTPRR